LRIIPAWRFFQDVLVEYFQPFRTGIKTDFLDGVFLHSRKLHHFVDRDSIPGPDTPRDGQWRMNDGNEFRNVLPIPSFTIFSAFLFFPDHFKVIKSVYFLQKG
jgi:hypothetical protein